MPEVSLSGYAADSTWKSEEGAGSQALVEDRQRRAASEGSLPMTGRAVSVMSGSRGVAREGESMSARTRAEREGQDVYSKGISVEDTET